MLVGGIGSATAARLVTGKQIKNGSIQFADLSKAAKKKLLGKPGARGTQGSQGAQGAQGAKGDTGAAGPFPSTLPSGKTVKGAFTLASTGTAAGERADNALNYGFALETAPTVNILRAGDPSTAACPGTFTDPAASPGNLCVYERFNSNTGLVQTSGNGGDGTSYKSGAGLFSLSAAAGNTFSTGSWAVTAP